ncbi:MAG TPA: lytic murein transglycosylase [Gaiellaceae bacterium]|nr:lytic murein transglycosylase [Gaiellaceae bacterium]
MKRLALVAALAACAVVAGGARADTFTVVPSALVAPLAPDATATPEGSLPYSTLLGLWQKAGAAYGVPWQVLAAINKIESNFGRNEGPSSAGAIGWMQFEPSTWMRWGTDANGDGVADPWNATDAIFSAARYLAAAGASSDLYRAVFAYNHADWYVNEVLDLADLYANGGQIAFSLDELQERLDADRQAVALDAAAVRRAQSRLNRASLLSDQLALQPAVARAKARFAASRQALAAEQSKANPVSFSPAASQLLGGATYSNGYAFPVGGGPGVVTAAHTHHDYPAVDIAAPLGSPVYALSAGTVQRAWNTNDPKCGLGLTFVGTDGQTWTYCHMATVTVSAGDPLTAGEQVGLVGATGDATGPHLHLQLQPANAWPQQEAWFQSFAGTAFTWSDEATPPTVRTLALVTASPNVAPSAPSAPVFKVVPQKKVILFSQP